MISNLHNQLFNCIHDYLKLYQKRLSKDSLRHPSQAFYNGLISLLNIFWKRRPKIHLNHQDHHRLLTDLFCQLGKEGHHYHNYQRVGHRPDYRYRQSMNKHSNPDFYNFRLLSPVLSIGRNYPVF